MKHYQQINWRSDFYNNELTESLCFRYLYYGEVNFDEEIVLELLYAAHKYLIPSLATKCGNYLAENMDSDNVWWVQKLYLISYGEIKIPIFSIKMWKKQAHFLFAGIKINQDTKIHSCE